MVSDPADLDKRVHAYMKTGEYSTVTVEIPAGRVRAKEEALTAEQVTRLDAVFAVAGRELTPQP